MTQNNFMPLYGFAFVISGLKRISFDITSVVNSVLLALFLVLFKIFNAENFRVSA